MITAIWVVLSMAVAGTLTALWWKKHETRRRAMIIKLLEDILADLQKQIDATNQKNPTLEAQFLALAKEWREKTGGSSLIYRRYQHPTYQAMLALGPDIVPFVLRELATKPDRWFDLLRQLTGENPDKDVRTFDESVDAWLAWGRKRQAISGN